MTLFIWGLSGVLVGILANAFLQKNRDVEEGIIVGIIGSYLGGFFLTFFSPERILTVSFSGFLAGFVGAIVFVWCALFLFNAKEAR